MEEPWRALRRYDRVGPLVERDYARLKENAMLYYALIFLVVAIIAAVLGFGGIAGAAAGIAKILFFVFLILFIVSLFVGRRPHA